MAQSQQFHSSETGLDMAIPLTHLVINTIKRSGYIKKYQTTPNNKRLKVIIEDIVKSGKIQKDDLTIVVIDGK